MVRVFIDVCGRLLMAALVVATSSSSSSSSPSSLSVAAAAAASAPANDVAALARPNAIDDDYDDDDDDYCYEYDDEYDDEYDASTDRDRDRDPFVVASPPIIAAVCRDGVAMVSLHYDVDLPEGGGQRRRRRTTMTMSGMVEAMMRRWRCRRPWTVVVREVVRWWHRR